MEALVFLLAGGVITGLGLGRRQSLRHLSPEALPQADKALVLKLRSLLGTAFERTLYLGLVFLALGAAWAAGASAELRLLLLLAAGLLFVLNIPPRHRAMRLLQEMGLEPQDLRRLGVRL